jgi:hypothetical protein
MLAAMFPEARFVHIIRDGRDVALSTMAIDGVSADAVGTAFNWKARVGAGRSAGRALGPGRYHEVRYEALVDEPSPVVAGVCRFLDLEFRPEMLRFFERPEAAPPRVQENPRHRRLAEPLSRGERSWRTHMTASDLEAFEAVAGGLLSELGYERGAGRPSRAAWVRAEKGRISWHAGRIRVRVPGMLRRASGSADRLG